jgi:predicted 3-demethylubiquinone-9 3-methyltransferase (glyoxalase superfamily)
MSNITTCLWFDGQAEEAANFYVKIFTERGRGGKIGKIARYGEAAAQVSGQPKGSAMTVEFELDGNGFLGLNGGPLFKFSIATSFMINCATQDDVDYFWSKLSEGGTEGRCGWIDNDKFGVTWQIVPALWREMMGNSDSLKIDRTMKALLTMKKPDIAALKKAAEER